MLYYIFRYLSEYGITGAHLWSYISFRSLLTLVLSLVLSMWLGEYFIKWMQRHDFYEEPRSADIDPFSRPRRVPSMGGLVLIMAIVIPTILLGRLRNIYMLLMLGTTVWMGLFGFMDDWKKIKASRIIRLAMKQLRERGINKPADVKSLSDLDPIYEEERKGKMPVFKHFDSVESVQGLSSMAMLVSPNAKDGIRPLTKLIGQGLLGLAVGLTLWLSPDAVIHENVTVERQNGVEVMMKSQPVKSNMTTIPFVKEHNISYGGIMSFLGEYRHVAGWMLFVAVTLFFVMLISNGANLNDGMDGMCAGNSSIMFLTLAILAYVSSHIALASYLNIMYVPGSEELVVFLLACVGAMVGFLWYNASEAQMWMGDTGSLTIGSIMAVTAIIIHKEILLFFICIIFIAETLSSFFQTAVAKRDNRLGNPTGKKLRLFKRAPIHDTFRFSTEQLLASNPDLKFIINWPRGRWNDNKVTVRFWIITIIACAIAVATLKVR